MGQCLCGSSKCFKCGASEHMLKDCPQWRQPTQGRVFAMHAEEANPDTTLLTRNIFIKRVATNALLNSGATHSFISETFADYLGVKSIGLDMIYSMTVPPWEELSATSVVNDIYLELQGHLFYADLIVLPMLEFDVILGIGWLMKNGVLIDFQKRSRLVHNECQEFFAIIISAPDVPNPSIADVPVIRDFPDVFSDNVTRLPPQREVEFTIDLVLGTVPFSKASYRLAPAEMLELK
ncbi:uncharacterized protein [Primulina huaijiensis]|uniref:uncharacterized protein n=1 Tax=Primulina huaijiensis TaxID=1492673 RepID=UPI003CC6EEFE